jgi:hypothetical protein
MSEIIRTRNVSVLFKGDAYSVALSPAMLSGGWAGGQGVMWDDSPLDEFRVTYSDGFYGGFLLWGSNEPSDQWTALTGGQLQSGHAVVGAGGWLISTDTYEKYSYVSRHGGGPLAALDYVVGERLVFSLRGLFTREDEFSITGDPRGSNTYYVAYVIQKPRASNNWNLVLQTAI